MAERAARQGRSKNREITTFVCITEEMCEGVKRKRRRGRSGVAEGRYEGYVVT